MSEVHILPGFGKRNPDAMLECAKSADLESVTIIGWTDGVIFISSSHEHREDMLWDLKQAEIVVLSE